MIYYQKPPALNFSEIFWETSLKIQSGEFPHSFRNVFDSEGIKLFVSITYNMGKFSREGVYKEGKLTERGNKGALSSIKRYVKKLIAFASSTVVFGMIYSGGTTQTFLDLALNGYLSWFDALKLSFIKSLQYGTVKAPEFFTEMVSLFGASRPITAVINYGIPLAFLFVAYFYLTSFFIDLLDGREGEVFRYWFQAVITVFVMVLVFAIMNGMLFFTDADPTFNQTAIVEDVKQNGYQGAMYPSGNSTEAGQSLNESVSDGSANSSFTRPPSDDNTGGFADFLGGFIYG